MLLDRHCVEEVGCMVLKYSTYFDNLKLGLPKVKIFLNDYKFRVGSL
jgi:hypothetical protein